MAKKIYLSPSDQYANLYAYGNTNEMIQCRKISDACETALKRCGFEVINNKKDEMEDRVLESNRWGADLHVCIHTNAFNGKVSGTRIMSYDLSGTGYKAAKAVYNALAPKTPGTSENVSAYPNLYEVRNTNAYCVYVEAEFHDVPDIAKWIINNVVVIGEAIAEGICNYYGVKYVKASTTTTTTSATTTTPVNGNYASKVIDIAMAEVGYLEKKSNSNLDSDTGNAGYNNYTKYARDLDKIGYFYNGPKNGYAWCDVFVDWCFVQAFGVETAMKLLNQPQKSCGAGCYYSAGYFKSKGQLFKTPEVGDQIFFYDSSFDEPSHTGLVYAVDSSYVYTIEGNTSSSSGVIANGGGVFKKKYSRNYNMIYGYGRPLYDKEVSSGGSTSVSKPASTPSAYKPTVKEWQLAAMADGYKFPIGGADNIWGSECEGVAKKAIVQKRATYTNPNLTKLVQKILGEEQDGKCGPVTDAAIKKYQKAHGLEVDGQVGPITWKCMLGI